MEALVAIGMITIFCGNIMRTSCDIWPTIFLGDAVGMKTMSITMGFQYISTLISWDTSATNCGELQPPSTCCRTAEVGGSGDPSDFSGCVGSWCSACWFLGARVSWSLRSFQIWWEWRLPIAHWRGVDGMTIWFLAWTKWLVGWHTAWYKRPTLGICLTSPKQVSVGNDIPILVGWCET